PAILRPGRFDALVEIPLPAEADRFEIFQVHLRDKPLAAGVDVAELASRSEGLSGADIALICTRAGLAAIRRAVEQAGEREPEPSTVQLEPADLHEAF